MNVLFVIKKDIYSAQEPLGILYLSSILKQHGHGVFLSDSSINNIKKFIKEKNIGLFALSCMNTDYKYYLQLSKNVKKLYPKIPIIWGGPTPTYNPEVINEKGVDIICRGEGEIALLELVSRLGSKDNINNIPNLWIKTKSRLYKNNVGPFITDLDILPFPDRSLTYRFAQFKYSPIKFVSVNRGCPFNCSFCFNHQFHHLYQGKGKMVRARSVDNVIRELEEIKNNYKTSFFYFLDDVFPFDIKWISEFARKYKKRIRIPFTIVTSVVFVNKSYIKYLKEAGCVSIHIAIECGSEKIRSEILNKPITNTLITDACKIIKENGISICAYNMIGIPFSTLEDELETLDLNLKVGVDATYVFFCLPFLNTQLGKRALKAGLIDKKTEILSWFERIPLKIDNREIIEKFAYLFTIVALYPSLRRHLLILLKIPIPKSILKLAKDILNGYSLKNKIMPTRLSYQQLLVTGFYFILKRFTR